MLVFFSGGGRYEPKSWTRPYFSGKYEIEFDPIYGLLLGPSSSSNLVLNFVERDLQRVKDCESTSFFSSSYLFLFLFYFYRAPNELTIQNKRKVERKKKKNTSVSNNTFAWESRYWRKVKEWRIDIRLCWVVISIFSFEIRSIILKSYSFDFFFFKKKKFLKINHDF